MDWERASRRDRTEIALRKYPEAGPPKYKKITAKQRNFIKDLRRTREYKVGQMPSTSAEASALIKALLEAPYKKGRPEARRQLPERRAPGTGRPGRVESKPVNS
jgi:hypothetical protein